MGTLMVQADTIINQTDGVSRDYSPHGSTY